MRTLIAVITIALSLGVFAGEPPPASTPTEDSVISEAYRQWYTKIAIQYHAEVRAFLKRHHADKNEIYKGPSKTKHGNPFVEGQFHMNNEGIMEFYQGNGLWKPCWETRDEVRFGDIVDENGRPL